MVRVIESATGIYAQGFGRFVKWLVISGAPIDQQRRIRPISAGHHRRSATDSMLLPDDSFVSFHSC